MSSANRIAIAVALALGIIARADAAEQAGSNEAQRLNELQRRGDAVEEEVGAAPGADPISIDGQYVVGFNWTRNPQLRLVKNFASKTALGLSLKNPQAIVFNGPNSPVPNPVTTPPGGSLLAPTTQYSLDVAPDVIGKVAWDPGFGHYEVYGLGRAFRDRAGQENHVV